MFNLIFGPIVNLFNSIVGIFSKKTPSATAVNIDQTVENIAQTAAKTNATNDGARNVYAEITGKSWMERNWRDILMLLLISIILNNTWGVTYLHAKEIIMTQNMWYMLYIGLTGFVGVHLTKAIKE